MTPHLDDARMTAADGTVLPVRRWVPDHLPPRAVIVAVHGFTEYSAAFVIPGPMLANRGMLVYAYDQRGFGATPTHGYWAGTEALQADLATMIRLVAARHPDLPLFVLGESMGGAVAMVALADNPQLPVDGLILSAPAVWSRDTMNVFLRVTLWLADRVAPGLRLTGRGLNIRASDNDEALRVMGRDPMVIKDNRVDTLKGITDLMDDAAAAAPRLRVPILLLHGAHDEIIPEDSIAAVIPRLGTPPTVRTYDQGWHLLLRDHDNALVLDDIAAWIATRAEPPAMARGALSR